MQGFGGDYNAGRVVDGWPRTSGGEKQVPRFARNERLAGSSLRSE